MRDQLLSDLRYALRSLRRAPGFTVIAIVTLTLGIGANSAIFSVVNSVLLQPLPYPGADRLVMVWERNIGRARDQNVVNPANYLDWRDRSGSFEALAGMAFATTTLTGDDAEIVAGRAVTRNFFDVMGVHPVLGRGFSAEEMSPNAPDVLVLSDGLWRRRFGADRGVVGRSVPIAGGSATVIGVMPPSFQPLPMGTTDAYWEAWKLDESNRRRSGRYAAVIGRLKDGVTVAQAQGDMDRITRALEAEYPEFDTGWSANVVPLSEQLVGSARRVLWLLLGAVSLVLLIACANVGNLVLARAAARQREQAVRTALGASRWRIARQWLIESVIVSLCGGAGGLLLAVWSVDLLVAVAPADVPRLGEIGVDGTVLAVTAIASVLAGIAFGLPAAFAGFRAPAQELHGALTRTTVSRRVTRFRGGLVVAQTALALMLLAGAGLLIRSIERLTALDPGFDPRHVATMQIDLPSAVYRGAAPVRGFYEQLLERVRAMPGVQSASAVTWLPMVGPGSATSFRVADRPEPLPGQSPVADIRIVDPGYFQAMRIPVRSGRALAASDGATAPLVVVVSEALVRQLFPGEEAIGRRLKIGWSRPDSAVEIVGVVADARYHGFDGDIRPMIYYPMAQERATLMHLVYRTAGGQPLALAPQIRAAVRGMDRNLPVGEAISMDSYLSRSTSARRYPMFLLATFAGLALVLAAIGLYGVLSCAVGQRTHEIGVRMALGARPADVLGMVVRSGLSLTLGGVVLGAALGTFATRALDKLLYDVSPLDPLTFAAVAALLLGVALAAAWLPGRRATRVDPLVALRSE